jgi:hypothetical protein
MLNIKYFRNQQIGELVPFQIKYKKLNHLILQNKKKIDNKKLNFEIKWKNVLRICKKTFYLQLCMRRLNAMVQRQIQFLYDRKVKKTSKERTQKCPNIAFNLETKLVHRTSS